MINRKVILVFSISFCAGVCYLLFRYSAFGRWIKARRIMRKLNRSKNKSQEACRKREKITGRLSRELTALSYCQLEIIHDYLKVKSKKRLGKKLQKMEQKLKQLPLEVRQDVKELI